LPLLDSALNINSELNCVWERREVCTGCWWGSQRERSQWGDTDVDGRIILRLISRKLEWVVGNV
jgi:hypothetical protein